MQGKTVLVIDDEQDIRELICDILEDEGYKTQSGKNSDEAFASLAEQIPDALILDIWLKDSALDGLGILETVKRKYPSTPVIIISGHGNIETAISSLKMGAYDYIEKPFKEDRLVHTVDRAIEAMSLKKENQELKLKTGSINLLIGDSAAVTQLRQSIERVAPTGSRIFINGPAGSGKEMIARSIHAKSNRKSGPFVVLNAGTLGTDMVDHELFGTEDSEDLNAPPRKVGVFEQAHGGTLYIDEVTDIPSTTQGKFVRFLQDGNFERVGGRKQMHADVRVISATNKDIKEEISKGNFREDLYYRLNVVPLEAPSLKERREDIPLICDCLLAHAAETSKLQPRDLSPDAMAALQAYNWPGNLRQLRNVIEWLLIMCPADEDGPVTSEMLPQEVFSTTPALMTPETNSDILSMRLREAREVFERQYLTAQINRFGGNISRTASFIGMERSALHRKLKSLNVFEEKDSEAAEAAEKELATA